MSDHPRAEVAPQVQTPQVEPRSVLAIQGYEPIPDSTEFRHLLKAPNDITSAEHHARNHALACQVQAGGEDGEKAKWDLVVSNLKLIPFAFKKAGYWPADQEEAISNGLFGLIKAAEKYDPYHPSGAQFSTYALNWLNVEARRREDSEGSVVRIPVYQHEKLRKAVVAERQLGKTSGVTLADIAELADLDVRELADLRHMSEIARLDPEVPVVDRTAMSPEELAIAADEAATVRRVVASLPDRYRDIIERRFGLSGDREETLEQVGRSYGQTRENIRMVQKTALKRLFAALTALAEPPAERPTPKPKAIETAEASEPAVVIELAAAKPQARRPRAKKAPPQWKELPEGRRAFVDDRRGAVLYLHSLRRVLGRVPSAEDIAAANDAINGPSLAALTGPFGGEYAELVEAIKFPELSKPISNRKAAEQLRASPLYNALFGIIERHKATRFATVATYQGEDALHDWGSYDDMLEFGFDDDPYDYTIEHDPLENQIWLWMYHQTDHNLHREFAICAYEGDGLQIEERRDFKGYALDTRQQQELTEKVRSLAERLQASGQLNASYKDDLEVLPEHLLYA